MKTTFPSAVCSGSYWRHSTHSDRWAKAFFRIIIVSSGLRSKVLMARIPFCWNTRYSSNSAVPFSLEIPEDAIRVKEVIWNRHQWKMSNSEKATCLWLYLQLWTTLLSCSSLEINSFTTRVSRSLFNFISCWSAFFRIFVGLLLRWPFSNFVSKHFYHTLNVAQGLYKALPLIVNSMMKMVNSWWLEGAIDTATLSITVLDIWTR